MSEKKFSAATLKSVLLQPKSTAIKTELLGAQVYIRRRTAGELIRYEEELDAAQATGNIRAISEMSVQLVLDSLVNPDGSAIKPELLPTAAELLDAHDNPALMAAIERVKTHAIGKLDAAEKN
ncbi:phage tail protein [Pantoea agglomerans]|uniref:phage tail protein n=1 Tax=Enterobacter agglomerans TaxID=549 RepID=UPI003C79DC56